MHIMSAMLVWWTHIARARTQHNFAMLHSNSDTKVWARVSFGTATIFPFFSTRLFLSYTIYMLLRSLCVCVYFVVHQNYTALPICRAVVRFSCDRCVFRFPGNVYFHFFFVRLFRRFYFVLVVCIIHSFRWSPETESVV